jgi:hypothetical protein
VVVVLAGLTLSATELKALDSGESLAAASVSLPRALPFLAGAPSPLFIMAVGTLVVAVTFSRRFRSGRSRA